VRLPQAAESKGWKNGLRNEYLKLKNMIFGFKKFYIFELK